jgi:hypothetical protein
MPTTSLPWKVAVTASVKHQDEASQLRLSKARTTRQLCNSSRKRSCQRCPARMLSLS